MSGVSNGQVANQTTFNNAFIARNGDSNTIGKLDLENADSESGDDIVNIQRELNANKSFTGMPDDNAFDDTPVWTDTSVGSGTNTLLARAEALTAEFNPTGGHTHDGSDSALIDATDLDNVRLRGYFVRGTNLSSVTGSSLVVTTQMAFKTPSTADTVKGVVVVGANQCILRDNFSATQGDQLRDGSGDLIYGRITYAATVWTLSFYKNVAGVETAHSFSAQDIGWYYQELFSPTVDAPIYSELASVPSDNATQDVVDATASQRGLVSTGTQSFGGVKTFADTTQSTTKDNGAVVLEGGLGVEKNVNVGGNLVVTGTAGASNLSGTNTGDVTLAAVGAVPSANGASLSGQVLTLQPASSTLPGLVTAGTQSLGGAKTFIDTTQSTTKDTGAVILEGGLGVEKNINAGGTVLGSNLSGTNTGDVTLAAIGSSPNANGASLTGQALVLQPADATFGGVLTAIAQSVLGVKTWVNGIVGQAYLAMQRLDVASTASITQLATTKTFVKLTGSTATTIHGAAAGVDGQILTLHNGSSAAATVKHQSGTATAADRFLTSTGADVTVAANSSAEFVYDTGQSRWVTKSGSGSGSGSSAGGMSLRWVEDLASPTPVTENNDLVYGFTIGLSQKLYARIKVPLGYTAGSPINLRLTCYSPDSSGSPLIQSVATLVRTGTDTISSTTNQRTSTNSALTLGAGTVNKPQAVVLDLTSTIGQINGVAVAAGDLIGIQLTRNFADSGTSDIMVPVYASEVTFS
jgi:hypothetical protein